MLWKSIVLSPAAEKCSMHILHCTTKHNSHILPRMPNGRSSQYGRVFIWQTVFFLNNSFEYISIPPIGFIYFFPSSLFTTSRILCCPFGMGGSGKFVFGQPVCCALWSSRRNDGYYQYPRVTAYCPFLWPRRYRCHTHLHWRNDIDRPIFGTFCILGIDLSATWHARRIKWHALATD